ncbi:xenotropic and polytropic retrovirus receptor 1 [Microdochium nivale]|nr:xenotropic and polytropic retrovirus receptor 1 [Microdochium nivale]
MKFGQHLEEASEPGWGLHNVDYNALKYQIRTHTTRDQATAVAIPGQVDYALKRFEDAFYAELCAQHDRVGLFVSSKADEISRRIRHLTGLIKRLTARCDDDSVSETTNGATTNGNSSATPWIKRRRKFAKYSMQATECGDDIRTLIRFVDAQTVAFRKILKKYRKWTGSTSLNSHFRQNILSSPKSFTQRDMHPLQLEQQELLLVIKNAPQVLVSAPNRQSVYDPRNPSRPAWHDQSQFRTPSSDSRGSRHEAPPTPTTYWNEYDFGSEAGDRRDEDAFAIYVDPDQSDFPDFSNIKQAISAPFEKFREWLKPSHEIMVETRPLLGGEESPVDYFTARHRPTAIIHTDTEATEDEYVSSDEQSVEHEVDPRYMSFAKLEAQRFDDYRESMMARTSAGAFAAAFALLIFSCVLVATAGPGFSLQLGAGVTTSSVASLFCACMGLGAMFGRDDKVTWMHCFTLWAAFGAVSLLNGFLLVVVVGRAGI